MMLIDQNNPIYPKIMKKSTCMSSAFRRCWMPQPWWICSIFVKTETRLMSLTTDRVLVGTQQAASLHRRSVADGVGETTVTCTTSTAAEMHATGLKISAESESALNRNNMMIGIMITMVPTMTNLTGNTPVKVGIA
jgi:hypothetical protein